jgi:hypothetical protein
VTDFLCTDYNITSAARVADYLDIHDTEKLKKLCTCWYGNYPMGVGMFCRPEGGCDAVIQGGYQMVRASIKEMNCP